MVNMRIGGLLTLSPETVGNVLMRLLGPVLLAVLFSLITFMTYTYFTQYLPHLMQSFELWQGILWTCLGLLILYNILFNYILCVYTGPGYPLPAPNIPSCRTCKGPKPPRSHHCSVCNKCVLKMDHHCPWIMNCVGLHNHRYFVLFLFYLTLGSLFLTLSGYSKFSTRPKNSYSHVCFILAAVFFGVLLLFTAWHLFLVFIGMTTIEVFGFYGNPDEKQKYNFSRGNWRKNLETVFATSSLVKAVLPSFKELGLDGRNWPDTLHSI